MKEIAGKQVYDSLAEMVNPKHTAVIVVDMQNDFCSPDGNSAKVGKDISLLLEMVPALVNLVEEARRAGVLVVFIKNTTLRSGLSDSPSWLRLKTRAGGLGPEYTIEGTWGQEFILDLPAQVGEPVVKKHRSSAFVNTDLNAILRCNGIESIIVTGCLTNACVLATALTGSYNDYYVIIPSDCVGSFDLELHDTALKVMDRTLEVVSSQDILKEWASLNTQISDR